MASCPRHGIKQSLTDSPRSIEGYLSASPILLTWKQAAAELHVQPTTLRRWVRQGRLPAVKLTQRCIRINRADIEAFIAARTVRR